MTIHFNRGKDRRYPNIGNSVKTASMLFAAIALMPIGQKQARADEFLDQLVQLEIIPDNCITDCTGDITITKQTTPDGSDAEFKFTLDFRFPGEVFDSPSEEFLKDGESLVGTNVSIGFYTITESDLPDGWELENIECTIDGGDATLTNTSVYYGQDGVFHAGDQVEGTDNSILICLSPGGTVECTYNNKANTGNIIVKKLAVAKPTGPTDTQFTFNPSYGLNFSLANGEQNDSGPLVIGIYSVSEVEPLPTGWVLTSATCDDGSDPSSIDLAPNETVTCTFENTERYCGDGTVDLDLGEQCDPANTDAGAPPCTDGCRVLGKITIKKDCNAASPPEGFQFTSGNKTATLYCESGNDTASLDDLPDGTYSFAETFPLPTYWSLENIGCVFDTSYFNNGHGFTDGTQTTTDPTNPPSNSNLTLHLKDGEAFVCTYTNKKKCPDFCANVCLNGVKDTNEECDPTDPNDPNKAVCSQDCKLPKKCSIEIEKQTEPDGSMTEFSFEATGLPTVGFDLLDGGTKSFTDLDCSGPYSVKEQGEQGWKLTRIDCTPEGGSAAGVTPNVGTGTTGFENLDPGVKIKCTYTNTKACGDGIIDDGENGTKDLGEECEPPNSLSCDADCQEIEQPKCQIHIKKEVCDCTKDQANTEFDFGGTALDPFKLKNDGTKDSGVVDCSDLEGRTVIEAAKTNWELKELVCDSTHGVVDRANRKVTFSGLEDGDNITCTFKNKLKPAPVCGNGTLEGTETCEKDIPCSTTIKNCPNSVQCVDCHCVNQRNDIVKQSSGGGGGGHNKKGGKKPTLTKHDKNDNQFDREDKSNGKGLGGSVDSLQEVAAPMEGCSSSGLGMNNVSATTLMFGFMLVALRLWRTAAVARASRKRS